MNRRVPRSHLMISFRFKGSAVRLPGPKFSCTIPFTTWMTLDKPTNPLDLLHLRGVNFLAQDCGGGRIPRDRTVSARQAGGTQRERPAALATAVSSTGPQHFCLISSPLPATRVSPKMTWMGEGATCRMQTPGPCL